MKKFFCALLLSAFVGQAFAVSDAERQIIDLLGQIATNGAGGGTGLTDTQLRASAVPVSVASLPLPSGAATAANQSAVQAVAGAAMPANAVAIGGSAGGNIQFYRIASVNKDLSAVTITTIATVWTPASGKKFRLMGGSISVSAAGNVLFEDNSAGAGNFVYRTPKLAADTPYNFVVYGGQGKLAATADNVLKATASAAGTITGTIYGTEE